MTTTETTAQQQLDIIAPRTSARIRRVSRPTAVANEVTDEALCRIRADVGRLGAATRQVNELSDQLLAPAVEALKTDPRTTHRLTELAQARGGAQSLGHPRKSAGDRVDSGHGSALSPLATITPGLVVLSPPWDTHFDWPNDDSKFVNASTDAESSAIVYCRSRNDAATGDGGAGFSLSLTSPVTRAVSIRPYMPCDVSYDFWSSWLNATSRGGFGIQVTDNSGTPVFGPIYPEVWNHTALNEDNSHFSQSDVVQAHLPNGEIAFTMDADETYHLWLWIWAHGDSSGLVFTDIFGNDYGSRCSFEFTTSLPFIVIL